MFQSSNLDRNSIHPHTHTSEVSQMDIEIWKRRFPGIIKTIFLGDEKCPGNGFMGEDEIDPFRNNFPIITTFPWQTLV